MAQSLLAPVSDVFTGGVETDEYGIALKLATAPSELKGAFRLTYESYLRAGLTPPREHQLRVTPYQLQESSEVFVAIKGGEVISTISLVCDGPLGLPIDNVFGPEVEQFRQQGLRLAEVSCLADRRESVARSMPMLLRLMRLLCQNAAHRGVERFLIAVNPRHARYYKRLVGFRQMGEERSYSAVLDRPAVALYKDSDYLYMPNTEAFDSFFANPCPREQVVRDTPRSPEFLEEMWSLATDG